MQKGLFIEENRLPLQGSSVIKNTSFVELLHKQEEPFGVKSSQFPQFYLGYLCVLWSEVDEKKTKIRLFWLSLIKSGIRGFATSQMRVFPFISPHQSSDMFKGTTKIYLKVLYYTSDWLSIVVIIAGRWGPFWKWIILKSNQSLPWCCGCYQPGREWMLRARCSVTVACLGVTCFLVRREKVQTWICCNWGQ